MSVRDRDAVRSWPPALRDRPPAGARRDESLPRVHVFDARGTARRFWSVLRGRYREPASAARDRACTEPTVSRARNRPAVGAGRLSPLRWSRARRCRAAPRATLVGARDFADSQSAPGGFPKRLRAPTGETPCCRARRAGSSRPTWGRRGPGLAGRTRARGRGVGLRRRSRDLQLPRRLPDGGRARAHRAGDHHLARARSGLRRRIHRRPRRSAWSSARALPSCAGRASLFADVIAQIALLGAVVGEEARADALVGGIAALLADLDRRLPARGRCASSTTTRRRYTMGRGTLVGEILARAGGATSPTSWASSAPGQIGIETILALEPEAIVMPRYADNVSALEALGADADLAAGAGRARRAGLRDPGRVDRDRSRSTPRRGWRAWRASCIRRRSPAAQ